MQEQLRRTTRLEVAGTAVRSQRECLCGASEHRVDGSFDTFESFLMLRRIFFDATEEEYEEC